MLRPTKHSHPDRTLINVAYLVLQHIRIIRLVGYSDLRNFVKKKVSGGDIFFLPSLNFLYLLGLIEYRPKIDAVEYVGPNETI